MIEGAFTPCSFWLVECLARSGKVRRARLHFEKLVSYSNELGLFAEEIGPGGEQIGNIPQALTHLALISAAYTIELPCSIRKGHAGRQLAAVLGSRRAVGHTRTANIFGVISANGMWNADYRYRRLRAGPTGDRDMELGVRALRVPDFERHSRVTHRASVPRAANCKRCQTQAAGVCRAAAARRQSGAKGVARSSCPGTSSPLALPSPPRPAPRRSVPSRCSAAPDLDDRTDPLPDAAPDWLKRSRRARSLWTLASRVQTRISQDNLMLIAAGIAFYGMFAIFPALGALVSIYGLFGDTHMVQGQVQQLTALLPHETGNLINQSLNALLVQAERQPELGPAVQPRAGDLGRARRHVVIDVRASTSRPSGARLRSVLHFQMLALGLTLGAIVFAIIALTAVAIVPIVIAFLPVDEVLQSWLAYARWPMLFVFILAALDIIYRFGPSSSEAALAPDLGGHDLRGRVLDPRFVERSRSTSPASTATIRHLRLARRRHRAAAVVLDLGADRADRRDDRLRARGDAAAGVIAKKKIACRQLLTKIRAEFRNLLNDGEFSAFSTVGHDF